MNAPWPRGFARVPDEPWTRDPVEELALKYDTVEHHGWYANLDPTVEEVAGFVRDGDVLVDYSGGTGILIDRLLHAMPDRAFGIVNVDSSPKFLRLSLEKLRGEERVAFRLIRYLRDERRLQYVDEVLGEALVARRVDALLSTNAVHLYHDLDKTFASWFRVLRPGGRVHLQSGNIGRDEPGSGRWIIDETVEAVHRAAVDLVQEDPRFADYHGALDDAARMARYDELRRKYFIPVRPLSYYLGELRRAGFRVERVTRRPVLARTRDWLDFLKVYHEGILGWVGGAEKVEGRPPTDAAVRDRQALLEAALRRALGAREEFEAEWTYLDCSKPP